MTTAAASQSPVSEPPSGDVEADPGPTRARSRSGRHGSSSGVGLYRTGTREGLTMTSQLHPFWSTKRGIFLVLLIIAAIVGVIVGGVIGGRNARGGNSSGSTPRSSTTRRASTATSSESTSSSGGAVTPSTSHPTATSTAVPTNTIS